MFNLRPYLTGIGMLNPLNAVEADYAGQYGWSNPDVIFIRGRYGWDFIEPSEGTYNWSGLDALATRCATYNKKYSFNIGAGQTTPQWVYDAGATKYLFHDSNEVPVGYEPLPWDLTFQSKYFAMLNAAAQRYGNDPRFYLLWANGFQEAGDMLLGSANDEINMPHSGYSSVDSAYLASAENILRYTMVVFPNQKVLVNYFRVFPTTQGQIDASTVKNFLMDNYPYRGGIGVSAIFAKANYGPPQIAIRNGREYPHGGQQVEATTLPNGDVNSDAYDTPPNPLPGHPQPFLDMVGNALNLGNTFLEVYQADLNNTAIQNVLADCNRRFAANVLSPRISGSGGTQLQRPRGQIQDLAPQGEDRLQFKQGDTDVLHSKVCLVTPNINPFPATYRITEEGDIRLTEDGSFRIV